MKEMLYSNQVPTAIQ